MDEHTEKEDNYTGGQMGKYLHPEELSKFKIGETIRMFLQIPGYGMTDAQNILIMKKYCTL